MSDPRLPLGEEPEDLGEIEDIEEVGGDADEGDPEDTADVEAEGSEDGAEDQSQAVERQPSRRERQAAHWRSRAETVEREAADLRRRLEAIEARQTQPQADPYAQQRAQQAEQERLANMTYEERVDYLRAKDRTEVAQALQGIEFRMADRADKQAWLASTQTDRTRARLSNEVERTLEAERRAGRNADREIIYKYLLGDELDRARREGRGTVNRQRQAANGRVRRQTTRPASGRGDTGRTGGRSRVDADEALLRGITAADI